MIALFTLTLFLSSALLFLVEPMFAKMVLPVLGSSPAVWNTSVLFFQAALLAGYAYAHGISTRLAPRHQAVLHTVLLGLALLILPVAIPAGWSPPTEQSPVVWLLAVLVVGVGLPFFVLSSTAPLLQRWFARTGHRRAGDPYFLYRASNLGSALGLVAYPILVEPRLALGEQAEAWTLGYVGLVAMSVGCAVLMWRTAGSAAGRNEPHTQMPVVAGGAPYHVSGRQRLLWLALAAVPASLMLGVTTYLTSDISPIPLLWIIPLALYLLSFVVAFSPRAGAFLRLADRALPLAVLLTAMLMIVGASRPLSILITFHLATFFLAAVVCHSRLAASRPPAEGLTGFYLVVALGGALGGMFNAIVAPVIFNSLAEYPLVLVLALLLRPQAPHGSGKARRRAIDLAVPVGAAAVVAVMHLVAGDGGSEGVRALLIGVIPIAFCLLFLRQRVRLGLALGAVFLSGSILASAQANVLYTNRTFFGIQRVEVDVTGGYHLLMHGRINHGVQSLDAEQRDEPLAYFTRKGPLGQIVDSYRAAETVPRVGVVGLGTGSMACYREPGEEWTFYELDPEIERIARDPRLFTFLADCAPNADVVLGDARLSLARDSSERYGLLAVDAFSSDAIPVHLITREALDLYLDRLAEGGVLALHISNGYVDLEPVIANLAARAGLVATVRLHSDVSPDQFEAGMFPSHWVALARDAEDLAPLLQDPRWSRLDADETTGVWTDDFSNLLAAFRWS
jgi:spermidine synthase